MTREISAKNRRVRGQLLCGLLLLLCGVTLFCRLQGANPASLRLDDQWLAIVAQQMTAAEFLSLRPPVPFGYAAVQAALSRFVPDPEWSLQLVPITASIVQLPLMGLLVWRQTGKCSLAFLAATLLAVSPILAEHAVTAKQYATDSLLTVILLLVGAPLLRRWTTSGAIQFAVCAIAGVCFAFPAVFVGLAVFNAAWLLRGSADSRNRAAAGAIWLAFHLLLGLFYWFWLRKQSNHAMQLYWIQHFIAVDSLPALGQSIQATIWSAMRGAFPVALQRAAILAVVGLVVAIVRRPSRPLGICFAMLYGGAMLASALWIYPLGTGRTDSYLHPVTILLAALPLNLLLEGRAWSFDRRSPWRRVSIQLAMAWRSLSQPLAAVFTAAGLMVLVVYAMPTLYQPGEDALLAQELARRELPDDLVIVYPHAEFAIGYYTDWPKQLRPCSDYAHGFDLAFERPNTLKLPPPTGTEDYPLLIESLVSNFLRRSSGRVFYLATHIYPRGHLYVVQLIEREGYRPSWIIDRPRAQLFLFEKASRPAGP